MLGIQGVTSANVVIGVDIGRGMVKTLIWYNHDYIINPHYSPLNHQC